MKRIIITILSLAVICVIVAGCSFDAQNSAAGTKQNSTAGAEQTSVANPHTESQTPSAPVSTTGASTDTPAPSAELPTPSAEPSTMSSQSSETPTASTEPPETSHKDVLDRIYEACPILSQLGQTVDYASEYAKGFFAKIGREISEEEAERLFPKVNRIDPFSEQVLPVGTEEQIADGTRYGELLNRYGFPNYGMWWSKEPENSRTDLEMHTFWFLETGDLMRVICDGRLEYDHYIEPGTSWKSQEFNNYSYIFFVRECTVISLNDFLNGYEQYVSIAQSRYYDVGRTNPHALGVWPWDEWPEIFIKKYKITDSSEAEMPEFSYNPSYFTFDNLETLGIALKGYGLTDVVKNDPRFSEEDKEIIRKLQENKGHNSFMFDIPVFTDRTYKLCDPVKLIYESDIKKGAGAHDRYVGFGIGFTVTDGENGFDLDMYDWFVYDKNPEYTEAVGGKTVLDNENTVVIELGVNGSAVVYDLYLNKRDYHARLLTNAPIESVLSLVEALQLDVYIYDDFT